MTPREMTTDQIRDRLAILDGYTREEIPRPDGNGTQTMYGEPTPSGAGTALYSLDFLYPDTLDGAHAAMPPGTRWGRTYCDILHEWEYNLWREGFGPIADEQWVKREIFTPDTGDPRHDLYLLALLARSPA